MVRQLSSITLLSAKNYIEMESKWTQRSHHNIWLQGKTKAKCNFSETSGHMLELVASSTNARWYWMQAKVAKGTFACSVD